MNEAKLKLKTFMGFHKDQDIVVIHPDFNDSNNTEIIHLSNNETTYQMLLALLNMWVPDNKDQVKPGFPVSQCLSNEAIFNENSLVPAKMVFEMDSIVAIDDFPAVNRETINDMIETLMGNMRQCNERGCRGQRVVIYPMDHFNAVVGIDDTIPVKVEVNFLVSSAVWFNDHRVTLNGPVNPLKEMASHNNVEVMFPTVTQGKDVAQPKKLVVWEW